jgi:t-SNARE complex subunit (syntaxin)
MLQEWEYAKVRQNAQLERIERGVGTLQEMAKGMQEELDKQNPVIDEIDTQLNKVTNQIKNNNAKLTGLVTQVQTDHQRPLSCHMIAATMKIIPGSWLCISHPNTGRFCSLTMLHTTR